MTLHRAWRWACVLACAGTVSCLGYPDTSERLDDDIVLTRFDAKANFGSYATFTIRPDIPLVDGSDAPRLLDEAAASRIVEAVARNMTSRGYVRVEHPLPADLGIEISITTEVNTQRVCYSYGYYRGYGDPYWGYSGYSYYAPYGCTTSSWTSGTVLIDLLDLRATASETTAPGTTPTIPAIWLGAVYRVLSTTAPENLAKAEIEIDQAFRQSPYLRAGSK